MGNDFSQTKDQGYMKGQHTEKMQGMFSTKSRSSESHHKDIMQTLEENKKKYDRQLYSDWIVKVYNRCTGVCLKPSQQNEDEAQDAFKLREVEKQCARNCLRKYDRSYKLFESVEQKIFTQYMEDQNIDPSELANVIQNDSMNSQGRDMAAGESMISKGKI